MNRELGDKLRRTLAQGRRRLARQTAWRAALITTPVALILGAIVIAIDQRWGGGLWTTRVAALAVAAVVAAPVLAAIVRLGSLLRAALTIDESADLKDRLSSAWEFLAAGELDDVRTLQVQDAIDHAQGLHLRAVLKMPRPRYAVAAPLALILFVLSFFVPAAISSNAANAAVEAQRLMQLEEMQSLNEELARALDEDDPLRETLERLKEIEKQFEEGALDDREVMIELSRLDEQLKAAMAEGGAEQLSEQVGEMVPHLMAHQATQAAAQALKKENLDEAGKELQKLAEKVEKGEIDQEAKEKLARQMGVAAQRLSRDSSASFSGDFDSASASLKSGDSKGFKSSMKSMGKKFKQVKSYRNMKNMRNRMSMCKSGLGQCKACGNCNGKGCGKCDGTGKGQGQGKNGGEGLGAQESTNWGTGQSGSPFGDPNRLSESYREMVNVAGMAGEGPVDSEIETVEGQTSDSQMTAQDLYAEYAAVAEEAIDQEAIPLSHRFHVKRYFQSIRPAE